MYRYGVSGMQRPAPLGPPSSLLADVGASCVEKRSFCRGLQSFLPLSLFACLIISESNTRHVVKSELTSAGKGRRLVGEEIERRESVRHFRQCCHRTNSCLPVKLSDDLFLSERFGICCSDLDDTNDIAPVWF